MIQTAISAEQELVFPLFAEKNLQLFVKRDDLIHPFISGNKWRKLKYNLQAAREQGSKALLTFGGAFSNHLVATACAGAAVGFGTIGIVRGEPVANHVLSLCRLYGMELHFVSRTDYREKEQLQEKYSRQFPEAYVIPEGGANELGEKGCEDIVHELQGIYSDLFVCCGTGTTAKGIIQAGFAGKIHLVPVLKSNEHDHLASEKVMLHKEYHRGGYAVFDEELVRFICDFSSHTGILLDPVYTGKLFAAVFDLAKKDAFVPGSRILVIHTGGLTGVLSDKFLLLNK